MTKPYMNLDEVQFDDVEDNGIYTSSINTGTTTMRYLSLSTMSDIEACEYPDSNKVLVVAGPPGPGRLRKMVRGETTVEYYDREHPEGPLP